MKERTVYIETQNQSFREKIDKLNDEAWKIRVSDSNRAFALSKEAVELAKKTDHPKGMAEALRTLGFSYIRLSKHNAARICLTEAQRLFESLNNLRGLSDIYEYFGIIERSLGNYEASLESLTKGLELRKQTDYREGESLSFYHIGVTYKYLGNYEKALEHLLQSLAIARELNYWISESYALNLIGLIYFETGDFFHALEYYDQSLTLRLQSGDKWGEAGTLDNIGLIHFKMGAYENAIDYCSRSLAITETINDYKGQANCLLHLGNIYEQLGNFQLAVNYLHKSLRIRREIKDKKGEAEILLFLADFGIKEQFSGGESIDSVDLMNNALKLATETKALDLIAKIHFEFCKVYKYLKEHEKALMHLENYIEFQKELHTEAINQKIQNLEITHRAETSKKEAEIFRLRNIELANLYEESQKQKDEIETQKKLIEDEKGKSDSLLLNILPEEIADELKRFGKSYARKHEEVSVLFADIKGFTNLAEFLSPDQLVTELDDCFRAFDLIIVKYGIEKIKTIGDAYMCASGMPRSDADHAVKAIKAALDMQNFIHDFMQEKSGMNLPCYEFRIGIHTGPVISGVVGVKKFAYDIWGDTVNIASRMQQSGDPGKINISSSTYHLVKDKFKCTYRGKINAKNKGQIDMYFVEGENS